MSTIKDVAKRAEVSVATVSYVINKSKFVSDRLAKRVLQAIKELNYRPNVLAQDFRKRRTHIIGLVVSDITNPFFPEIVRGVEDVARGFNYNVFLCNTDAIPEVEELSVKNLYDRRVEGMIFTSVRRGDISVRRLKEAEFPFVLVNRRLQGIKTDFVGIDNVGWAKRAVEHLIGLGHQRIGFIGGAKESTASLERFEGYKQALNEHNINLNRDLIQQGDLKQESGYLAAKRFLLLEKLPTAIFAANDLMAIGALEAILEANLKVPEDIALMGFDDVWLSSLRTIQLTTVRQPRYEMGREAARLLLKRIRGENQKPYEEIILPCELVVRRTCGARLYAGYQDVLSV